MAALGPGLSACSTPGFEEYCRYSDEYSIREADPQSLALVLGVTSFAACRSTTVGPR
jgi:hypothetical protein